jgi:hypothetical protein
VDSINEVQYKIKVKIGREKYCLMAKNNFTKLLMEMPVREYLSLNNTVFHGNPCAIFKYLVIDSKNRLKLRNIHNKDYSQDMKSYISHY